MKRGRVVSRVVNRSLLESPNAMPPFPWWDRLEADFADRDEDFGLALEDRLQVGATAALDVLVRTAAATAVGALAFPLGYHPRAIQRVRGEAALYTAAADAGDPDLFFRRPPDEVTVRARSAPPGHFVPAKGACRDLSFDSPFVPLNPRLHERWRRHRHNSVAHARHWTHDEGPRPTLVAIHGFGAEAHWLNEWFFQLPDLYAMGYDVMLFTLPFHGPRQGRLSPFSGHGFFAGGVEGIAEAVGQAVLDFRIFLDHLLRQGAPRVGVTGISLGGYTSAMLAAVEPRLHFVLPNVPVASLPDLVLEWRPLGGVVKALLRRLDSSIHEARHLLASACPLSYPPRLPRERLMIIGGAGDRMAPPNHARLLWDHWGRCRLHWFPGSHLVHLDKGDYVREMARFFKAVGF